MKIRRSRLTRDFIQVPNATARDDRLSHMARGVLIELISRPDGWETTADDMWRRSLAKHGKNSPGRRAFRAAFAELKEHGYLTAEREVLPGGRFGTVLTLTDVPHAGTSVSPAKTPKGHAAADVPHGGTPGPPAETGKSAGGTDVPLSDVPHGGTSNKEDESKKTKKTEPPSGLGPKPSDPQGKTAAPSSLRSEGLPSKAGDDHVPAEDSLPVVRTATIPARARGVAEFDETELNDRFEAAAMGRVSRESIEDLISELDTMKRHHMQGCGYCQQGPRVCHSGGLLLAWWGELSARAPLGAPAPF